MAASDFFKEPDTGPGGVTQPNVLGGVDFDLARQMLEEEIQKMFNREVLDPLILGGGVGIEERDFAPEQFPEPTRPGDIFPEEGPARSQGIAGGFFKDALNIPDPGGSGHFDRLGPDTQFTPSGEERDFQEIVDLLRDSGHKAQDKDFVGPPEPISLGEKAQFGAVDVGTSLLKGGVSATLGQLGPIGLILSQLANKQIGGTSPFRPLTGALDSVGKSVQDATGITALQEMIAQAMGAVPKGKGAVPGIGDAVSGMFQEFKEGAVDKLQDLLGIEFGQVDLLPKGGEQRQGELGTLDRLFQQDFGNRETIEAIQNIQIAMDRIAESQGALPSDVEGPEEEGVETDPQAQLDDRVQELLDAGFPIETAADLLGIPGIGLPFRPEDLVDVNMDFLEEIGGIA